MEMNQTAKRIHPLMAGAAASVMLVSLVGAAAITGLLPTSHGTVAENSRIVVQPAIAVTSQPSLAVAPPTIQQSSSPTGQVQQFMLVPVQAQQQAATPEVVREVVKHKTIVHHKYVQHPASARHAQYSQYAQTGSPSYNAPAPVYQQTRADSVSPLGMGVGAVVGGLVGSRVGGGNGKTLATIAGAVGGGYLGNEVAKRYP